MLGIFRFFLMTRFSQTGKLNPDHSLSANRHARFHLWSMLHSSRHCTVNRPGDIRADRQSTGTGCIDVCANDRPVYSSC